MKTCKFKLVTVLSLFFLSSTYLVAQVNIGNLVAPKTYSILELSTKNVKGGLLMPQLTKEERDELTAELSTAEAKAEANGLVVYNTTEGCLNYYNGKEWRSFCEGIGWFHMPSIAIDVSENGEFSRDLYIEYRKQFANDYNLEITPESPKEGTDMIKSNPAAPAPFKHIYERDELYFYVIGYDDKVFSKISITESGILEYEVKSENVSDATYMNIVLAVK